MSEGVFMAQAAARHDVEPRSISFKGAVQTLQAFQPVIAMLAEGDPGFFAGWSTNRFSMPSRLTGWPTDRTGLNLG